jgi:endonuclease/exonuclease/phosphatase (EEP) superfamily protein YafD
LRGANLAVRVNRYLRVAKGLTLMLVCVTAASYLGRLHFALDLLSNFKVHYAALFVLSGLFFMAIREHKWLGLSLFGLVVNLAAIVPWYTAENTWTDDNSGTTIRILVSNVHRDNRAYERLSKLVLEQQPDVLGLIEVDSLWLDNLPAIRGAYQFRFESPREDLFGLALFSKLPMTESRIVRFGESAMPAIVASFAADDQIFEIILVHSSWPMTADRAANRNAQLRRMAQYIQASDETVVVAGDLNTTMWSPYYQEFEHESGMINARAGYGIGATWSPIHILGIPIDHILVKPPAQVGHFHVLQGIGSDHLAISADVSVGPRSSQSLARSAKQ